MEQEIATIAAALADFSPSRNANIEAANALAAIAQRVGILEGFANHARLRHGANRASCTDCAAMLAQLSPAGAH